MKKKQNIGNIQNHNNNSINKNASRKHSGLAVHEEKQQKTTREFKPRFILKQKEIKCNQSEENDSIQCIKDSNEYLNIHQTLRKYQEQQEEIQRLKKINKQYRDNLNKFNAAYKKAKDRTQQLTREYQNIKTKRHNVSVSPVRQKNQKYNDAIESMLNLMHDIKKKIEEGPLTDPNKTLNSVYNKLEKFSLSLNSYSNE